MYSGPSDVKQVVKTRQRDSSKRDFGSLLVVGGSDVYSGAPALAGLAALRTGCGLAVLAVPASVAESVRSYSPNLIVHSLSSDIVTPDDGDRLADLLSSSDAMVLGPGIGRSEETNKTILLLMEASAKARKPVLVDADALRALAESKRVLAKAKAVITPHAGEFKAISGEDAPQELRKRISLCKKFAADYSCVLLLKGHNTIVSDGNRTKVNPTGNPGMAVGGTGDVLSGIIGAFLAQGAERFQAAVAGAYVHGLTGDLVHRRKGFHMMASDLIEALPSVLQAYDRVQRN